MKKETRFSPVTPDRSVRHTQGLRGFLNREITKEAKLHDPSHPPVEFRQTRERFVQLQNLEHLRVAGGVPALDLNRAVPTAAFQRQLLASMADEDLAHGPRGDGKEVNAILPFASGSGETNVYLIDHRGRAQGSGLPAAEVAPGNASQILVHDVEQAIPGPGITFADPGQEAADLFRLAHAGILPFLAVFSGPTGAPLVVSLPVDSLKFPQVTVD